MIQQHPSILYCIGLGGVGVSAVARLYLAQGWQVVGSDPQHNPIIDDLVKLGAVYHDTELPEHIPVDCDLVVYTDDTSDTHVLRQEAVRRNIPSQNFSVALGTIMLNYKQCITIAGTNGKSTTTALTGLLLANADADPTVVVGSRVTEFSGNVRIGAKSCFVVEADEYHDHFLHYHPTIAVITNIEDDHLDYFGTHERMLKSFSEFVQRVPKDGIVVVNADDANTMNITGSVQKRISFGLDESADLRISNIVQAAGEQSWECMWQGKSLGRFTLHIPGTFNIMNATAAMAAALAVGVDSSTFQQTLTDFFGIWRRFEILNRTAAVMVVSDYAHHPTAVRVTLEGAKAFYPGRRIIAVFQPHHRSRLTSLFDDFTESFTAADEVIIVETYSVPGRDVPEAETKTSRQLVDVLTEHGVRATYVPTPADAEQQLYSLVQPGDVLLIMGAGNIWHKAEQLAKHYG